ncbi:MAG TPA: hypothetical protein VJ227_04375 [Patescibacteria group bacterium]|nr:hypothetical protein [Patescibacteria group bacterium]
MLCWTLLVFLGVIVSGSEANADVVMTGKDLAFETDRAIVIEAETVTLEAVDYADFYLIKEDEAAIFAVSEELPLGWSGSTYFHLGPQEISGGRWEPSTTSADYRVSSEEEVTIRLVERHVVQTWFMFSLLGLCIWLLVLILTTA